MRNRRAGSRFGGGIKDVWVGKGVGTGRAALKLKQGEIPACFFRFKPDEPENEANPARSVFVQLKHARDKPVGSAGISGAHWKGDGVRFSELMYQVKQSQFRTADPPFRFSLSF